VPPWTYNGAPFSPSDIPPGAHGFVYEIARDDGQCRYIGRKAFWKTVTRPPLKGSTKKRRTTVPSDWESYWSSSNEIAQQIAAHGHARFSRTILGFADSSGALSYLEAELQFRHRVLIDPAYVNGIIQCRIGRSHVQAK